MEDLTKEALIDRLIANSELDFRCCGHKEAQKESPNEEKAD